MSCPPKPDCDPCGEVHTNDCGCVQSDCGCDDFPDINNLPALPPGQKYVVVVDPITKAYKVETWVPNANKAPFWYLGLNCSDFGEGDGPYHIVANKDSCTNANEPQIELVDQSAVGAWTDMPVSALSSFVTDTQDGYVFDLQYRIINERIEFRLGLTTTPAVTGLQNDDAGFPIFDVASLPSDVLSVLDQNAENGRAVSVLLKPGLLASPNLIPGYLYIPSYNPASRSGQVQVYTHDNYWNGITGANQQTEISSVIFDGVSIG